MEVFARKWSGERRLLHAVAILLWLRRPAVGESINALNPRSRSRWAAGWLPMGEVRDVRALQPGVARSEEL